MKIVLAAALAVGGGAVWWKSAKTEGTSLDLLWRGRGRS